MRPWLVLLLAACGAAPTAPVEHVKPADEPEPETVIGEGRAATHAEALAQLRATAEVPAGYAARILDERSVRFDGPGPYLQLGRSATDEVPTLAAFIAKGGKPDDTTVLASEQWEGGWWAVLRGAASPTRTVHAVIGAGKDDLICVAIEDEEGKGSVDIATKFCRSVQPR